MPFTYPTVALRPLLARAVRDPSRLPPDQQTFPGLGQPPSLAGIPADGGPDHIQPTGRYAFSAVKRATFPITRRHPVLLPPTAGVNADSAGQALLPAGIHRGA